VAAAVDDVFPPPVIISRSREQAIFGTCFKVIQSVIESGTIALLLLIEEFDSSRIDSIVQE
jgi:hypothetical protein